MEYLASGNSPSLAIPVQLQAEEEQGYTLGIPWSPIVTHTHPGPSSHPVRSNAYFGLPDIIHTPRLCTDCTIYFGDWDPGSHHKVRPPGGKAILANHSKIIKTDKFKTPKTCNRCLNKMGDRAYTAKNARGSSNTTACDMIWPMTWPMQPRSK